jgi:hypothetical protein
VPGAKPLNPKPDTMKKAARDENTQQINSVPTYIKNEFLTIQ